MKSYNKLVRDNIPEYLDSKGISYKKRIANKEEYKEELIKKLDEEIKEFMEIKNTEELADITEVIEALKKLPEFANVEEIRLKKFKEKGGFEKKVILKGEK
ncbi:MAG: nucleoside triphosphate pyrophosphohydrolase [Candidatus Paceibacterota bacterium]